MNTELELLIEERNFVKLITWYKGINNIPLEVIKKARLEEEYERGIAFAQGAIDGVDKRVSETEAKRKEVKAISRVKQEAPKAGVTRAEAIKAKAEAKAIKAKAEAKAAKAKAEAEAERKELRRREIERRFRIDNRKSYSYLKATYPNYLKALYKELKSDRYQINDDKVIDSYQELVNLGLLETYLKVRDTDNKRTDKAILHLEYHRIVLDTEVNNLTESYKESFKRLDNEVNKDVKIVGRILRNLAELSTGEVSNFTNVKDQWILIDDFYVTGQLIHGHSTRCICKQNNLFYNYTLVNKLNNNIVNVGSTCYQLFTGNDLNFKIKREPSPLTPREVMLVISYNNQLFDRNDFNRLLTASEKILYQRIYLSSLYNDTIKRVTKNRKALTKK